MLQEKMYVKEEKFVNRFPQKVLGFFYITAADDRKVATSFLF